MASRQYQSFYYIYNNQKHFINFIKSIHLKDKNLKKLIKYSNYYDILREFFIFH